MTGFCNHINYCCLCMCCWTLPPFTQGCDRSCLLSYRPALLLRTSLTTCLIMASNLSPWPQQRLSIPLYHPLDLPRPLIKRSMVVSNVSKIKFIFMLDTAPFYLAGAGPILQARPPPEDTPNHMTDWSFKPKPSSTAASQHTAVPPTLECFLYAKSHRMHTGLIFEILRRLPVAGYFPERHTTTTYLFMLP